MFPTHRFIPFLLLAFALLLSSCDHKTPVAKDLPPQAVENDNEIGIVTEVAQLPDTCKSGWDYEDVPSDLYFKKIAFKEGWQKIIKWGKKGKGKIHSRKIDCSPSLRYASSNDDFVLLIMSCGTYCAYSHVLPMHGGRTQEYTQPLAIDLKRNYIAYKSNDEWKGAYIIIENLKTRKKVILKEYDLCPAMEKRDCIDCSYFDGKDFVISWQGSHWSNSDLDPKTSRIEVDF